MFGISIKDDDEVMLLLEIQYLAIQEIMTETGEFPTRDEVVQRAAKLMDMAVSSNIIPFN